jgi:Lon protease-like protein
MATGARAGELPLFPLNTVLFPGGLLPLQIFEQRYMAMAKACLRDSSGFGVCLIRHGGEVGAPATPEPVGCTARIVHWDMEQLGVLKIVAQGERRFRVGATRVQDDGLVVGEVELLAEDPDGPIPEALAPCRTLLERIVSEHGERLFAKPFKLDSSAWVSARLAEVLPLAPDLKQSLLELEGPRRLEALARLIVKQA